MNIIYHFDIVIITVSVILLALDKKFESRFKFSIPIAASYALLRFLSLDNHYQTSAFFHFAVLGGQWLLAIIFFQLNSRRITAVLIFLGSISNLLVIVINDLKMPCRWNYEPILMSAGYTVMSSYTHLNLLGDRIRIERLGSIFSIGDILIIMGMISLFLCYIWFLLYKKRPD